MTIELSSQYNVIPIIILNGDFETGDLSNWIIGPGEDCASVKSSAARSGNYGLEINNSGTKMCGIYSEKFDVTHVKIIRMWYKLPTATGYYQIYIYLYKDGVGHQLAEIIDPTTLWTQLEFDVSQYTGIYQFEIFVRTIEGY